jgi:hypothetical protein
MLAFLTTKVPDNGVILDLNCGQGRSTISMALGLIERGNQDVSILAVDSHVTNPLSDFPLQDGTIMKFLDSLAVYNSMRRVVPMIMPVPKVLEVLNRKCANLVVVQSHGSDLTTLNQYIDVAKFALRTKGIIAVCLPCPVDNLSFPESSYRSLYTSKELMVYESFKKGE